MKILKNKRIGITGGTGSFGTTVLRSLIPHDVKEIRILSRDEKKQDDLRRALQDTRINFIIGDVRDKDTVHAYAQGLDYIFHAAALKQVPSCEFFPMEAFKTNVIGTSNVIDASILSGVSKVICLSTDKAVYPINAMGLSKAMLEKIAVSKSRSSSETSICVTRYGNVLASRGSLLPNFIKKFSENKPLTITDGNMTRFLMTLDEAVKLVLFAFEHGENGDILVQKSPASTVSNLTQALIRVLGREEYPIHTMGIRHSEKMYEVLLGREEKSICVDLGNYYRVPADNRDLNYEKYFSEGNLERVIFDEFNSNNTDQLSINEIANILSKLPIINDFLQRGIVGDGF